MFDRTWELYDFAKLLYAFVFVAGVFRFAWPLARHSSITWRQAFWHSFLSLLMLINFAFGAIVCAMIPAIAWCFAVKFFPALGAESEAFWAILLMLYVWACLYWLSGEEMKSYLDGVRKERVAVALANLGQKKEGVDGPA